MDCRVKPGNEVKAMLYDRDMHFSAASRPEKRDPNRVPSTHTRSRTMSATIDTRPALAAVDAQRVLDLEQRSLRIPSSTFEEGDIADLYADYMSEIGLEVEMQPVTHPFDPT